MNPNLQKGGKLLTFLCLYIAQSIPMSFFSTVLPVIMRQQDYPLEIIGMLQFMKLPWILKMFWSPLVDKSSQRLSDYKRWIFSSEIMYAVIIFSVSFLDFKVTPWLILGLVVCSFIASATQDIATDALAVLSFGKKDKSLVNSMQSLGSFGGAMIGGGLLLLLYHRMGWSSLLPLLALFVLISILPLLFFKEKHLEEPINRKKTGRRLQVNDLLGFFKQKGIGKQVVFLLTYNAGIVGILAMLKPMLVDFGYSIKEIGIMSGIVGTSVGCITSLAGGFIVRRIGRKTSRALFAVFTLLTTAYFYLLVTVLPVQTATLHLGITMLWGCYGLVTIVVYTTAMDRVRKGYEGTDFTIQTVMTHLSGMIMAVVSGKIAGVWGYDRLFIVGFCIALFALTYILFAFRKESSEYERSDFK